MERLERFYKIDQLLKNGRPVPFARLCTILEVSPATLKRDFDYMRNRFNAPIEYDREANGYRFGEPRSGPKYELPGLWFNASEVFALLTTLRLLGDLQPGLLSSQVSTLVQRLKAIGEEGDHSWKEIEKRIRIFQPERRAGDPAQFSTVAAALLKRRRLEIQHYNRAEDRITDREVSPQRLVHYKDNWYLDAYCHLREGLRSFAVDAIRNASLADARAKEVPAAELDAYLAAGFGIFAGSDLQWATLRFNATAARWVASQVWHPNQRHRMDGDGSYVLEVPYANDRELVMEILKFGADVEVMGPETLRERVANALTAASSRYRGQP
ncbi:MAG: YafY family transcriptional regulator [Proteobacteria bacterium]|nr:YafY family transcriptional regulator [Pseudomonadota bacterium]